ncbi:hypothetical protein CDL12_29149 [Handroanthus impetiginosus]|uniref:Uncharacterized protein n=1 Tax=Handroanthus impetiginosus TaxID=429701 RepID=A0A2G9FZ97_9LAMI|nr:hypothetical protein CDL12_29149 [Handroanthus impetiginosus]
MVLLGRGVMLHTEHHANKSGFVARSQKNQLVFLANSKPLLQPPKKSREYMSVQYCFLGICRGFLMW